MIKLKNPWEIILHERVWNKISKNEKKILIILYNINNIFLKIRKIKWELYQYIKIFKALLRNDEIPDN